MPNFDQIALIAHYLFNDRDVALYVIVAVIALRAFKPFLKTALFLLIARKISKTSSNERLLTVLAAALINDADVTIGKEMISMKKRSSKHGQFKILKRSLKKINPGTSQNTRHRHND
jgi:hypothetical protein